MWFPRCRIVENPEAVGRMMSAHPQSGDKFYMCLLLKNRAGALSYENLRTINGVTYPDFKSACIALNLCESDTQWIDCLSDAVFISVPYAICHLFANLLLHCQPSDPRALYGQFCDSMSEDFLRKRKHALNLSDSEKKCQSLNYLLLDLNHHLEQGAMSNADFNIPVPDNSLQEVTIVDDSMEHDPDAKTFFEENCNSLNKEQQQIFNSITDDISNKKGRLHRIDAPGGSGKTWMANIILCWTRMGGNIAISTAMLGKKICELPFC